jgi:chromosome segregation ATPase
MPRELRAAYVDCPWCGTSNQTSKLETRRYACRLCRRNIRWGYDQLRKRRTDARKKQTKAERRAATAAFKRTDLYKASRLLAQKARLERRLEEAWKKLRTGAEEGSLYIVKRATAAIDRTERAINRITPRLSEPGVERTRDISFTDKDL